MNSFLHLVNFSSKVVFLAHSDLVMVVPTLCQRDLKILLCLLEPFFVFVKTGSELFEKVDNRLCDLLHPEVVLFQEEDRVGNQCFGFLLATVNCGSDPSLHNLVKGLSWQKLGVVFLNEIFEVKFCYVDVFVGIFHVLGQRVHKSVEDHTRFFVEAAHFFL